MIALVRPSQSIRRSFRCAGVLAATLLLTVLAAARPALAQEDQQAALQKATELNKQAIQEYQAGKPDDARKLLKQAIDVCAAAGLEKHAIKARTHIHMGVVALMGLNNHDAAVMQFKKALDIQADIKLTKSLVTPEVEKAFEEAKAQLAGSETPGGGEAGHGETPPVETPPVESPKQEASPLKHVAVTRGDRNSAIEIQVQPDATLDFKRLVLGYRPEGASDFLGREMKKNVDVYVAEIPESATKGRLVSYYIEAQNDEGQAVANRGSVSEPYLVQLQAGEASDSGSSSSSSSDDSCSGDDCEEKPARVFLSLTLGTGAGLASGKGDMDMETGIQNGFGLAKLGHMSPEVGFFLNENWVLSAQLRLQYVTGTNGHAAKTGDNCGADNYCTPGNGAIAGFIRLVRIFGEERVRPFIGLQAGAGYIRHVGSFTTQADCGVNGDEKCVDSVAGGPILVGGTAGLMLHLTEKFAFLLRLDVQAGFSKMTVNFDGSAGFALRL